MFFFTFCHPNLGWSEIFCLCWQCACSSRRQASRKLTPSGPSIASIWKWWTLLTACSEPHCLICHSYGCLPEIYAMGINNGSNYLLISPAHFTPLKEFWSTYYHLIESPALSLRVWFEISFIDILCRCVNKEQRGGPCQRLVKPG